MTFSAVMAAIQLLWSAVQGMMSLAQLIEKNKNEKWFADSVQIFAEASKAINTPAVTDEEKKLKSQKLREYSRSLGQLISRV